MNKKKDTQWWEEFFTPFRPFFSKITAKETNTEVRYYLKKLNLKKGSKFLDCPVGIGRVAIPMAKKGIKITGVDITASYLAELKLKTDKLKLPIKLFHLDMRRINFENEFDAAGNLWTSFGYFEKESDDLLVLKKIIKALKPGGKFVMQVINRDWIIRNFTERSWEDFSGGILAEEREFDYEKSVINGKWIIINDGQANKYDTKIRIYSYHELKAMFEKAGFVDVEGFGTIKEEPISIKTRNMYLIGRKPKK